MDTFSLVAKITWVFPFHAITAIYHWYLHQLDIQNAFLHDLLGKVYMEQPPELTTTGSRLVCQLRHSHSLHDLLGKVYMEQPPKYFLRIEVA